MTRNLAHQMVMYASYESLHDLNHTQKCGGLGYINPPTSRLNLQASSLYNNHQLIPLYHFNFTLSTWLAIADLLVIAGELAHATVERAVLARVAVNKPYEIATVQPRAVSSKELSRLMSSVFQ